MKERIKSQSELEADTFSLLAGTMDFFIKDMEEYQESLCDKDMHKEYLSEARQMKNKLSLMSKILSKK